MRILVVTTSFPEVNDGSEAAGAFVADFVQELAAHAKVDVLAPGVRRDQGQDGRVRVHRFMVPRLPLSLLKPYNPLHWRPIVQTLVRGQQAVDEMLGAEAYDHLLALWALPSGYWARNARARVPYSTWALGSDIWTLGRVPLVKTVLRKVLSDAQLRFADGVALAEAVGRLCGRPCRFLPSSRRLGLAQPVKPAASAPFKLAFLGRFHPNKGIDLLLDALALLEPDSWRAIAAIRIAGGGPLQTLVERKLRGLAAKGLPVFLEGYKNREEAREMLDWADMVLIPSRIESIPVIFSDAMQAGKPVIATPAGDLPALIAEFRVGLVADRIAPESYVRLLTPQALGAAASQGDNTRLAAARFELGAVARTCFDALCGH